MREWIQYWYVRYVCVRRTHGSVRGIEMDGITFGAKLHERRVHVLIDGAAHFKQDKDRTVYLTRPTAVD